MSRRAWCGLAVGAAAAASMSPRTVESAAARLGMTVRRFPLKDWRDVDAAHLTWNREPVDGLLLLFDRVTGINAANIAYSANRLRLPAVYGGRQLVGGLVSYGIDWPAAVAGCADYLARVLDGAKPAELPVQQPTRFELVVNLTVARFFGFTVPQSVPLQAT